MTVGEVERPSGLGAQGGEPGCTLRPWLFDACVHKVAREGRRQKSVKNDAMTLLNEARFCTCTDPRLQLPDDDVIEEDLFCLYGTHC